MSDTQQVYISEKVRNSSNVVINPATEETQQAISQKKIGDSFWLKNALNVIARMSFDNLSQLRTLVTGTVAISSGSVAIASGTITTVTQSNNSIGDIGKPATMITTSNTNFQSGGRRLLRKI